MRPGRGPRSAPPWRLGLRARVTAGFGLVALVLSIVLVGVVWTVTSGYLASQRRTTALDEATFDAAVLARSRPERPTDVQRLLDGLHQSGGSALVLSERDGWVASTAAGRLGGMPETLVRRVRAGQTALQRVEVDGSAYLAAGVPIAEPRGAYFELFPLADLDAARRVLALVLIGSAMLTTLLGLVLGRFASRRALRPLEEVTDAASAIVAGDLGRRLDAEHDPDLGGLARSFNHAAQDLQRRVLADARFAADVSHELRTPLTTMLNSMVLLQNKRAEMPAAAIEPLDLLTDDLARFRRLVVDLLEICRDEDPADVQVRERVTIGDLVREAADAAAGRPVTTVEEPARDLVLLADKRRLERVVANLVENAEHHGGGCVAVRVHETAGGTPGVRIEVDDAGPGIPHDRAARVFERFARDAGSGDSPGVGLGLAIVERHVRWHGGTVEVADRPGGGARFVVVLPTQQPRPPARRDAARYRSAAWTTGPEPTSP